MTFWHKVQSVIDEYYGGNLVNLERVTKHLYFEVEKCLGIFAYYRRVHKLEPVGITWLRRYLLESKDYKSLRDKCCHKMNLGKEPISLNEFVQ